MSVRLLCPLLVVILASLSGVAGEAAVPQKDPAEQDSKPPADVSKEVLRFLNSTISLRVTDMSPQLALEWQLRLADIPLKIRQSKAVAAKKVSFELVDVTLAEALRTIGTKCGCQYRIVKDEIRMALPDEWKQVDAGKVTFDKLAPEETEKAPEKIKK